jgi:hypothetical protein
MGTRELVLGLALLAMSACATAPSLEKPHDPTPTDRKRLSEALEPLLVGAKLWRGPDDGCPASFGIVDGEEIALALAPHAPCRVKLILIHGTLTRLDRAGLRALLAHEIAHMQLEHYDARQARADARKETQKNVKTASSAVSQAVGFIPGVGGLISQGIGAARQATTAAMDIAGTPYLPEEEQAADAMAAKLLDAAEPSSCHALVALLEERLHKPDSDGWAHWEDVHPVSAERIAALAEPCPDPASR